METPATRWLQPYNILSWSIGLWPGATLTCLSVSLYSGNYVGQTTGHYIIKRNFSLEIIPPVTRLQWTQSDLKVKHANVKEQNFTHHWNFVALFRSANLTEPTINWAGLSDSSKCDCDRVCEVWRETVGYFSDQIWLSISWRDGIIAYPPHGYSSSGFVSQRISPAQAVYFHMSKINFKQDHSIQYLDFIIKLQGVELVEGWWGWLEVGGGWRSSWISRSSPTWTRPQNSLCFLLLSQSVCIQSIWYLRTNIIIKTKSLA